MLHIHAPWKYQKTGGFLFLGSMEVEYWLKMG